jgi:hypothetical protein
MIGVTIVNVVLPATRHDLSASVTQARPAQRAARQLAGAADRAHRDRLSRDIGDHSLTFAFARTAPLAAAIYLAEAVIVLWLALTAVAGEVG